eukprot:CAMPEP_0113868506 /NCGR_PEP_ID=MMETSP0780_2-20120614/1029_1 /TAXON_ID=652834 /ORGANISM="Palpitomonas bilix" /LENGTH=273 /DNA_ID=CAMNT_0000853601 /DNA_START=2621 /DNA_END=3442 /DNA_ORIENTATION=+ /assembly_acc=CAM_ASM_000599
MMRAVSSFLKLKTVPGFLERSFEEGGIWPVCPSKPLNKLPSPVAFDKTESGEDEGVDPAIEPSTGTSKMWYVNIKKSMGGFIAVKDGKTERYANVHIYEQGFVKEEAEQKERRKNEAATGGPRTKRHDQQVNTSTGQGGEGTSSTWNAHIWKRVERVLKKYVFLICSREKKKPADLLLSFAGRGIELTTDENIEIIERSEAETKRKEEESEEQRKRGEQRRKNAAAKRAAAEERKKTKREQRQAKEKEKEERRKKKRRKKNAKEREAEDKKKR